MGVLVLAEISVVGTRNDDLMRVGVIREDDREAIEARLRTADEEIIG